jgi:peptide/nickel transport system ATP-binding protein
MADRVQVMYGGTIVETAETVRLFGGPRMPYTVGLLGSVPNAEQVGRALTPIPGTPPSPLNLPQGCSFGPRCPLVEPECRRLEPRLVVVDEPGHEARCLRWEDLTGEAGAADLFVGGSPSADRRLPDDPAAHGARGAAVAHGARRGEDGDEQP